MGWVFLTGMIVFTVFGQLIIRHQLDQVEPAPSGFGIIGFVLQFALTRPLVIAGFISAFLSAMFWVATLTRFELSFAYPFTAINFIVVTMIGIGVFNETFNVQKIVGLLIVIIGLIVVAKGG